MIARLTLALAALALTIAPAAAHRLRLFVDATSGQVGGYAFFVGGGRPAGATIVVRDGAGRELLRVEAGKDGAFSFPRPRPGRLVVAAGVGDGHVAEVEIEAADAAGNSASRTVEPAATGATLDEAIDAAVARQVLPLRERIEAIDSRLRLADIIAGIGFIVGLAGAALWIRSRTPGRK